MKGFTGAWQIIQYNLRFYLASLAGCLLVAFVLWRVPLPDWLRAVLVGFIALAAGWTVSSVAVSYYIYDRSRLYRFDWAREMVPGPVNRWVNVHAGLDASSLALKRLFPEAQFLVLNIFDTRAMTEPAIKRARRLTGSPVPALEADFRALPVAGGSCDAAFVILAAHELRRARAREAFFAELHRLLAPGGRVLLVEHLRDAANFLAFGPGAFHFLARSDWERAVRGAGLGVCHEARITPFVHALLLAPEKP